MTSPAPSSPYVGLRPFHEDDYALFFGRDREIRVIASNIQARPLTVLYGASGVGKSSVLQAGVVRRLKQQPGNSVLYFREWQTGPKLAEILRHAQEFVSENRTPNAASPETPSSAVSETPGAASQASGQRTFLLLDQFEEFLLYHANDDLGEEFDGVLSRIINRRDSPVNVLIGLRDDSLFKLDRRFSLRIPNLLRDTLELQRMAPAGAKNAIEKPLAVFSKNNGGGKVYGIEPALVDEILNEVQAGNMLLSESSGVGATRARPKDVRIETAYLQLVLTKLWDEEQRRWKQQPPTAEPGDGTLTLHLSTLQDLGGAANIVKHHVDSVMKELASDRERDIAANMFRYLVTPSRSKIAQTTSDLVSFAEAEENQVRPVLDALTNRSESRILRKLSDPEQYEIFHDVLAQPLLDWRRAHTEALERKRARWSIIGVTAVAVLLAFLSTYSLIERHRAHDATEVAQAEQSKAEAAQKDAQAALAQQKADEAQLAGHVQEAAQLRNQATQYAQQAANITKNYQSQQAALDSASKQALASVQNANAERDEALKKLNAVQKELALAQQRIQDLESAKPQTNSQVPTGVDRQGKPIQKPAEEQSNVSSAPAPPMGLTAAVVGGGFSAKPASVPRKLAAGTTICATLTSVLLPELAATIFDPPALSGDRLEGKAFVGSVSDGSVPPALFIKYDTLIHGASTSSPTSIPITADLKSVKSSDSKHPLHVDKTAGNDTFVTGPESDSLGKLAQVCIVLKKPANLTARK